MAGGLPRTDVIAFRESRNVLTVTAYHSLDELAPLAELWDELWRQTPQASFLHSFPAFERRISAAGQPETLHVLIPWFGGRPLGILPLSRQVCEGPLRPLRVLGSPLAESGLGTIPLGPHPAATLYACARYLSQRQQAWDVVEFRSIPDNSPVSRRIQSAFATQRLPVDVQFETDAPAGLLRMRVRRSRLTGKEWLVRVGDRLQRWTRQQCEHVARALM